MKVAITGNTSGIGLALSNLYSLHGHEVIGFGRSNGYDISNPDDRYRIVNAVDECDMFINNAFDWHNSGFSQVEMLFDIWEAWQGQHRTIVNIGSSTTMKWHVKNNHRYRIVKRSLEDAAEFIWNQGSWPFVSIISPCLTVTSRTQHLDLPGKIDPDQFAKLAYDLLSQKDFRVQVVKLALSPKD
jgi:hypothetical protein